MHVRARQRRLRRHAARAPPESRPVRFGPGELFVCFRNFPTPFFSISARSGTVRDSARTRVEESAVENAGCRRGASETVPPPVVPPTESKRFATPKSRVGDGSDWNGAGKVARSGSPFTRGRSLFRLMSESRRNAVRASASRDISIRISRDSVFLL